MKIIIHLRTPKNESSIEPVILELWHSHRYRRHAQRFNPIIQDGERVTYQVETGLSSFHFRFINLESDSDIIRFYGNYLGNEVWCLAGRANVYSVSPATVAGHSNDFYRTIQDLIPEGLYLPETDVSYLRDHIPPLSEAKPGLLKSMLGANVLNDGSILFGLFHPYAAEVYVVGNFNDWQCPGHPQPNPEHYLKMDLYRGYYDQPNLWLLQVPSNKFQDIINLEYLFFIRGGVPLNADHQLERFVHDPMARSYSKDYQKNHCLVINPTRYSWQSEHWKTPLLSDLIIYELNVYGFTQGDSDIPPEEQGTFKGVIRRIKNGYFQDLGVNALEFMPTSEAPSMQGPTAMGYDPCGFAAIERDFGTPDGFRQLVDIAHQHGLAVILDVVFNHTSNFFNPLWDLIDDKTDGGFYFSGNTPWGNRLATEKEEVQNYLIDVCKLLLTEYRVDGFRFDATHSSWMSHPFLFKLQYEIRGRGFKPDCILIVENLPNEPDLNLEGWNGFAQWCDPFHDKIKALIREGVYQDWIDNSPQHLGDVFYFCKNMYASHTNNVINYCESHDENSVSFETGTDGPWLQTDAAKERKARLGLMATMVALGQPMIYMGQEFGIERERNRVQFKWPENLESHFFYQWAKGLIHLRRHYRGLRISGFDPISEGRFKFIIAPWLEEGKDRSVIGWQSIPSEDNQERLVILLNFEPYDIEVKVDFGLKGKWLKLGDIDTVTNLATLKKEKIDNATSLIKISDRYLPGFILPSSSGFIYNWIEELS